MGWGHGAGASASPLSIAHTIRARMADHQHTTQYGNPQYRGRVGLNSGSAAGWLML
jgi:hypothetical protein